MHSFSEGSEFRSLSPTSSDLVLILLSHVPWAGILRPDLQMGNLRLRKGEEQRGQLHCPEEDVNPVPRLSIFHVNFGPFNHVYFVDLFTAAPLP